MHKGQKTKDSLDVARYCEYNRRDIPKLYK